MGRPSRTARSQKPEDITNVEAWSEVFKDILVLVPRKIRADVLALVNRNEEAERREREANDGWLKVDLSRPLSGIPGLRHWDAVMRLESLIIQVLTRQIRNNHSPETAAKILFADHPNGTGSGWIARMAELTKTKEYKS
jgi:hypothetical protein